MLDTHYSILFQKSGRQAFFFLLRYTSKKAVCGKGVPFKNLSVKVYFVLIFYFQASQVVLVVKNLPPNAGDIRDSSLIPGWGRSPGGGHGNPLQYSCLENPMGQGAWWAMVHRFAKSLA